MYAHVLVTIGEYADRRNLVVQGVPYSRQGDVNPNRFFTKISDSVFIADITSALDLWRYFTRKIINTESQLLKMQQSLLSNGFYKVSSTIQR